MVFSCQELLWPAYWSMIYKTKHRSHAQHTKQQTSAQSIEYIYKG